MFVVLRWATHRAKWLQRRGAIFGLWLMCYGLFRTSLEWVRNPDEGMPNFPLGLTMGMILSIPMFVAGALLLWWGLRMPTPKPQAHAPLVGLAHADAQSRRRTRSTTEPVGGSALLCLVLQPTDSGTNKRAWPPDRSRLAHRLAGKRVFEGRIGPWQTAVERSVPLTPHCVDQEPLHRESQRLPRLQLRLQRFQHLQTLIHSEPRAHPRYSGEEPHEGADVGEGLAAGPGFGELHREAARGERGDCGGQGVGSVSGLLRCVSRAKQGGQVSEVARGHLLGEKAAAVGKGAGDLGYVEAAAGGGSRSGRSYRPRRARGRRLRPPSP